MKKVIERAVSVLKGVSTLDVIMRNPRIILLLLLLMTALGGAVRGGHSTLDLVDPSFNPQIETTALGWKRVNQILPLPDGKILVVGRFNSYNGQPVSGLVRLYADGTLDTTFSCNLDYLYLTYAGMIVQADGKILIAIRDDDSEVYQLLRLNADGSPDPTFSTLTALIWSMAIDAGGRIVVSRTLDGVAGISRLNSNGSPDPTFQFPSNEIIYGLTTQNNKIILMSQEQGIQRLNEDGTFDSSFIQRSLPGGITVQPDNKILVWGQSGLRRLNENGSDDPGFTVSSVPVHRMALAGNGRITVANRVDNSNYQIRRLLADGTADSSFTPYLAARFVSLAVQADGGVLIGDGDIVYPVNTRQNDFVRLFPDGSPDPTFNTGTGFQVIFPGSVQAIHVQPDQKILIGGSFQLVNEAPRTKIARLNADSTLDPTFEISTGGTANYFSQIWTFSSIRTQSDGKIIVSGGFDYVVNGVTKRNLVRLNSDGSIDPKFNLGVQIVDNRNPLVIFNDGKLLVGTSRSDISHPPVPVKLLATGARDISFNANLYPQDNSVYINDVALQPDGKIIIGGHRILPDGIFRGFLTRLNADGSPDTTFQTTEQLNKVVTAFVLLPNGKIVIAQGGFPSNVLRLNPNGSLDPTFNAGTGADGQVNAMLLLSTGRIFVGGSFTNFNGQPRGNLVQLNEDGSVFTQTYNINGTVGCLAVDADGRVLVGGSFTVINAGSSSANRSSAAALIDSPPTRFDFDGDRRADLAVFSAADGMWSILNRPNYQSVSTNFGLTEDKTVPADFDGDGRTDIAVYRPSDGTWYLLRSQDGFGAVRWGAAEDKPVAGDFDGDGRADFAVWRPSSGVWWILKSSTGETAAVKFGSAGDFPLSQADFDGDRRADIAVWRPSDGNFYWLASGSGNQFKVVHFGQNGDVPAVADYNGDGRADLVVFRPADGNWHQYRSTPTAEYTYSVTSFGLSNDEPVAADYDGDGKTDIAVRRGNAWHILHSTQGYAGQTFGNAGAQAVAAFSNQ